MQAAAQSEIMYRNAKECKVKQLASVIHAILQRLPHGVKLLITLKVKKILKMCVT